MPDFSDILLTVDYDRTLTAPDSSIPARNLEAIEFFMAHGGIFTVNTGRSVPNAHAVINQVPVNAPLLLYNGSAAYDPSTGTLSQLHTIDLDMWRTVGELLAEFPDLSVEVQGVDAHYCFTPNKNWNAFCAYNNCAYAQASPGQDLGPFLKFSLYGEIRDVTVAHMYDGSPEEFARMDAAEAALRARYGAHVEVFRAAGRIIDVHAHGVSKLRAARELLSRLGRKTLVCVGDAENDASMLAGADYSFCPADGTVAARFPNVCPCADGAVADVILNRLPEIIKKA